LKIFLSIADCIIPPQGGSPGAGVLSTVGVVDWAMERMPKKLRPRFLRLIGLVEVMGIFFGGRFFSKNSHQAKIRQLQWMENNPLRLLRMGFFGLKTYVSMGYYSRDAVWPTIAYEGPLMIRDYPDPTIRGICQGSAEVREL
jgi:hypothetical protein